jgi:hypothetical protein
MRPTMSNATDLIEMKKARLAILTGTSPKVVVDQNGERVEFQQANMGRLEKAISQLEATINSTKPIGPARVFM